MVPLHCPGGFATAGISPVSPPLPPFSLAASALSQWTSVNARTTRMLLGLPCAGIPPVTRVSGKCTDYSAISKNFFYATVQQNRLNLQTENKKGFRKHLCIRAISRHLMPPKHFGRTACCALPCTAVRLLDADHQKWEKWIFCGGGGRPEKMGMGYLFLIHAVEGALFLPLLPLPHALVGIPPSFPGTAHSATVCSGITVLHEAPKLATGGHSGQPQ